MTAPTLDEIKARVPASVRATRNSQAVADALNVGRTRRESRRIVEQDVLDVLGAVEGAAVLDAIRAAAPPDGSTPARRNSRPLAYAVDFLRSGRGLDVANPQTRAQLDGLAAQGLMTQAQADRLKALADVPDPASELEVRVVVWSPDGRWLAD